MALPIAFHLQSLSPALAALHVHRARRLQPEDGTFDESHCTKCGFFYLDGSSSTRTESSKNKRTRSKQWILKRTCSNCGFVQRLPLEPGNAAFFPKRPKNSDIVKQTTQPPIIVDQPATVLPSPRDVTPSQSSKPTSLLKNRKKKSGLQEMLARKRQEEQKTSKPQSGGLSSFLGSL